MNENNQTLLLLQCLYSKMKLGNKYIIHLITLVICLPLLVCAGCRRNGEPSVSSKEDVILIAINDIHGHIEVLPKIAAFAKDNREHFDNVLLLSAGDLFIGNAYVDNYPSRGFPIIDMMNTAGFDLSALGNHEFDFSTDTLSKRMKDATFPFVCANVTGFDAYETAPIPYKIFNTNNIRIGILGLIIRNQTSGIPPTSAKNVRKLTFSDPIKTALSYKWLRDSCDLFIVLSHIGIDDDKKLAEKMPEIDWIIGGHSHTLLKSPIFVNGVGISQNGKNGTYCTYIRFSKKNDTYEVAETKTIYTDDLKKIDRESTELYRKYCSENDLNYTIGKAALPFENKEELGYLMTDALTSLNGVDFAVVNPGGVRLNSLPEGTIYAKNICDLDPFGNTTVIYRLTASEIISLIEEEYKHSGMYLIPSGFSYEAAKKLIGRTFQVTKLFLPNGEQLDEKRKYRVAMNNYIAENYSFQGQQSPLYTNIPTTDNLIRFIRKEKVIAPDKKSRIHIKKHFL